MSRKRKRSRKRNNSRCKIKKLRRSFRSSSNGRSSSESNFSNTTETSFAQRSLSAGCENSPVLSLTSSASSTSLIDLTTTPTTTTSHNTTVMLAVSDEDLIDLTTSPATLFDTISDTTDSDIVLTSLDLPVIPCHGNKDLEQSATRSKEHDTIAEASMGSRHSSTILKTDEDANNEDELLSPTGTPLLFLYGCQSTGANTDDDHIVEIAAEVIELEKVVVTTKLFSELCNTSRPICGIGCGVTEAMLIGKREFSDVLPDFLSWIKRCIAEAERAVEKPFYPVLVAHNGFTFDFQILAAEVERQKFTTDFIDANLRFADTLYELEKTRTRRTDDSKWSLEELQGQLSIENIHKICFPELNCSRIYRALEDVQMMTKIFITSDHFSEILQSPTLRSATMIISDWKILNVRKQKVSHHCKDDKVVQVKSEIEKKGKKIANGDAGVKCETEAPLRNTDRAPLLFIYECQSTGGNIHDDHIIEIAAEVVGPEKEFVTVQSFSELCYTTRHILGIGCGVTEEMLTGKRIFFDVFPDFLSWINECVGEAIKGASKLLYPVLVAHNGFMFDFRILSAEVQRWGMMEQFSASSLAYADTLFELKKMRRTGHPIFNSWNGAGLSLDNIIQICFPQQHYYRARRALEDVHSMIAVFTTSDLSVVLQSPLLTIRSTDYIISDWNRVHENYRVLKEARSQYGPRTTRAMAKCLERNQLNYVRLQEIFNSCSSSQLQFYIMLQTAGVSKNTWISILWDHFAG